jgi:hypothetical protein
MLTLLGSLLGFITSAFPQLLGLIRDWQDRKHELAILDRQMEMQRQGHIQRLEEIAVTADIAESQALYRHDAQPSGVKWIWAGDRKLKGLVRRREAEARVYSGWPLLLQRHQPFFLWANHKSAG